jgi:hypothetical protein
MLERTVADLLGTVSTEYHKCQAAMWVCEPVDVDDPPVCSFRWVCESLDLNPDAMKAALIRMRDNGTPYYRTSDFRVPAMRDRDRRGNLGYVRKNRREKRLQKLRGDQAA